MRQYVHPWALELFRRSFEGVALSTEFANKVAARIVDNILDRGLGYSTWRDTHPKAYQDLRDYRDDIIAQVAADLQTIRVQEVKG